MNKRIFKGTMPALLTPLDSNSKVITATVKPLIDWEISKGAAGFYVCGSTGEGPVLSGQQRRIMMEAAVEAVNGRVPVIAHVGAIDSNEAFDLARHTETQASLPFPQSLTSISSIHIRVISITSVWQVVQLPLILYAAPMMAGVEINKMMKELLKTDNVIDQNSG